MLTVLVSCFYQLVLPFPRRRKKKSTFSWSYCSGEPLDLISHRLHPYYIHIIWSTCKFTIGRVLILDNVGERQQNSLRCSYEMKIGQWFNVLWQSGGWATLIGSQEDGKSQAITLALMKDCKSSGSFLQRVPLWKGTSWMAKKKQTKKQTKTFQQYYHIIKNQQHFWVTHSYWLISCWQSNSLGSLGSETRASEEPS